jgi:hypothetical protein
MTFVSLYHVGSMWGIETLIYAVEISEVLLTEASDLGQVQVVVGCVICTYQRPF